MQSKFQIIVIDLYPIELVHFIFDFYEKNTTGFNNYVNLHCGFEKSAIISMCTLWKWDYLKISDLTWYTIAVFSDIRNLQFLVILEMRPSIYVISSKIDYQVPF